MGIFSGDIDVVNSTTTGIQYNPFVTALSGGGWVVMWNGYGTAGIRGNFQQIYDSTGSAVGGETFLGASDSALGPTVPIVAFDGGGWLVSYVNPTGTIELQLFSEAGTPMLAGADTLVEYSWDGGILTVLDEGWLVTWSMGGEVLQRIYDGDGALLGATAVVNTTLPGEQNLDDVTALASGGWVVSWSSYESATGTRALVQQAFNATGGKQGDETTLASSSSNLAAIQESRVTALEGGGWVTSWIDDARHLKFQVYEANGTVSVADTLVTAATSSMVFKTIALDDGGWLTIYNNDGGTIKTQAFASDGSAVGATVARADGTSSFQGYDAVALDGGGWILTWAERRMIGGFPTYVQAFNADGTTASPQVQVSRPDEFTMNPKIALLEDGGFVVTYSGYDDEGGENISQGAIQRVFHFNNDAPTGADNAVAVTEDATHLFSATDFGFADTNGDALSAIVIETLPVHGALLLDGTAVSSGQEIGVADTGNLTWTPDKDAFGDALATIEFRLKDDGGTDYAGTDLSAVRALTFNVTDVVDIFWGNGKNNNLRGTEGVDILDGKGGRDKLTGNEAADTFIFAKGYDRDTINDFEAGGEVQDLIDVSRFKGIDNFRELKPLMEAHGSQVWIDFGHGDELIIRGVTLRELGRADFTF